MRKTNLSFRQIVIRVVLVIAAVALINYVFPHHDTFRYEYELGNPWRYGLLTANYDFPVYHNDSVIQQMEDSVRRQVLPIYVQDSTVLTSVLRSLSKEHYVLGPVAYTYLEDCLKQFYRQGILTNPEKKQLQAEGYRIGRIASGSHQLFTRSTSDLLSEKQVYDSLTSDTVYSSVLRYVLHMEDYVRSNLVRDTAAMNREYKEARKSISTSYRVVVAETRIIDQGQIVDARTKDVLDSYRRAQEERLAESNSSVLMQIGQILLIAMLMSSMLGFLFFFRKWHLEKQSYTFVAVGMVTLMVVLTSFASHHLVGGVYLVPIGVTTIVLATFHGSRTAYWCHMVMVLLCSFIAPSHFEYLVVQSVVGIIIIFFLSDGMNDRGQLLRVCLSALFAYPTVYCAYTLANEGTLTNVPWLTMVLMACNALLLMMSYLIIYALERLFGFVSGVTLVELCNMGQGLLLRLSKEAPGTFQHSIQVSNLAAAAAETVHAKTQLVRTGALYHDIGKLWNPVYYTENQMGVNPHSKLKIEESVELIKKHVSEGVILGKKAKLPKDVIRFIETHHGCGTAKYFYRTWCNAHPDETPDMSLFSYPGPDPETKEEAILMMSDSIEAASKSLKEYNHTAYRKLVDSIVDGLVTDGRLNNARITLQEINMAKKSFVDTLEHIYKSRIEYPELKAQ
ncbi:MAG: HDIG domain-containing protein [Bacteroidales bacterium]|jgi:putative nucleotidyltransferase with HDIG domain|nr:HDIG domain-containing protein [Bacteroidales bacterium]MBP5213324.1 HDIG domain-containing protein [Bacteroidales bacterium]